MFHHVGHYFATWQFVNHHDCDNEQFCEPKTVCCTGDCDIANQLKIFIDKDAKNDEKESKEKSLDNCFVEELQTFTISSANDYQNKSKNTQYLIRKTASYYIELRRPPIV
jgi:hypothetical protein